MTIKIPSRKRVKQVWPSKDILNPGSGLNNVISDEYIEDTDASDLKNIMFVERGNPAKRNGHTAVGTGLVNPPKGLASYYSGTNKYLVTVDGTGFKYLNGTTWTAIAGATQTTGKNTTFVQAKGDLYAWNGTDAGRKLSGLTLTAPTTTPSAAFGIYYNSVQIVAGTGTNVNRLYVSNQADMSDFTVTTGGTPPQPENSTEVPGASTFLGTPSLTEANIIDISKDDGDKITGLAKFNEKLIIFKERSTYSLTFDSSSKPTVVQVSGTIGCVSHRSIDNVENDVFFLSRNGYYTLGYQANFNLGLRTNELSAKIHPVIETITAANLGNTCSIFDTYTFYSSVSTGGTTTNNTTLTYDKRYQAWSKWTNVNANSFSVFFDTSNVKHIYYASDNEAQVYEIDTGYSDNGTAIDSYWVSKALNFGNFSLTKQLLYVDIEFRALSGTVSISVITDGNTIAKTSAIGSTSDTTGTIGDEGWGSPMWGGTAATSTNTVTATSANVPYRIQVNKPTRTFKLKISNSNNNEAWVLLGFKPFYRPYAQQKFDATHIIH